MEKLWLKLLTEIFFMAECHVEGMSLYHPDFIELNCGNKTLQRRN